MKTAKLKQNNKFVGSGSVSAQYQHRHAATNVSTQWYKTQKGITLIALVITIIILLILAGVTINMVIGENGIFKVAEDATVKHEKARFKRRN